MREISSRSLISEVSLSSRVVILSSGSSDWVLPCFFRRRSKSCVKPLRVATGVFSSWLARLINSSLRLSNSLRSVIISWKTMIPCTSRTLADPGKTVVLPSYSKMVDWEVELTAVIGKPARNVPVARALDHVAGYTAANDLSARDLTKRAQVPDTSPFKFDWLGQKNFDDACPLGPWIVPAEDIPDPQNLALKLWVNDVIKQDSHTSKMIFSLAEQIAHISSRLTLHPGDLVLTGTPAGVGLARKEFLKAGDVVKIWVEGVGTLTNTMG